MTDEHPWLSKDLLVRLRWWAFKFCGKGEQENLASDAMSESVSRIEKLEEEIGVLFAANVRLNSRADLDSDGYVDRIEKLEAALRWICGSRTIEYFDGTVQADETKMIWTYRRIAREALEGIYDERIFKDPT